MEYWSVEKKPNTLAVTPTFQYSNTPKLDEFESLNDGLPYFGLQTFK